MRILLIRHARAEDRTQIPGRADDSARRLTARGRRDMRKAARGLCKIAPELDLLAASPLRRAQETAGILARAFGGIEPVELPLLAPGGSPLQMLVWLATLPTDTAVALVGHEPDLGRLASWLLSGKNDSFVELKKGAACLIEFDRHPKAGAGRLLWAMTPGQLRTLADA